MTWDSISLVSMLAGAYLIGSFPSAYLASRIFGNNDIRDLGDRNAGAANVYRNLGPLVGVSVAIVDMGKGAVAVLLAMSLTGEVGAGMMAGLAAVVGHNWPFFLQFKGGRGASTALGALMALVPVAAIPMSLGALILLLAVRNAVVVLNFVFIPLPLLAWFVGSSTLVVTYCVVLPVVVGLSHFVSIRRVSHPQQRSVEAVATQRPHK